MDKKIIAVTDSPFPNLDAARAAVSKIGGELQASEGGHSGSDSRSRQGRRRHSYHLRQSHHRSGSGADQVPDHRALRHRRGQRRYRHGHQQGNRGHEGSRLLHRRSFGSRHGAAAGRRAQDSVFEQAGAGRAIGGCRPWCRSRGLRGRTLGLVGFGRIPQLVAPKAQAFGIKVVTYDPFVPKEVLAKAGVEHVEFEELVKTSDYISLHCPLMPETKHIMNAKVFAMMKPRLVSGQHRPRAADGRSGAGRGARQGPIGRRGARRGGEGTAHRFADSGTRQRDYHAAHRVSIPKRRCSICRAKAADEVVRVLSGQAPKNPVNPEALKAAG